MLAAYTQVKVFDTEWAFIAEISTSEAYRPIRQLETLVILLGAGSLLLLILFSRWLSHSITAPLHSSPPPPSRWPMAPWITPSPSPAPMTTSTGSPRRFATCSAR